MKFYNCCTDEIEDISFHKWLWIKIKSSRFILVWNVIVIANQVCHTCLVNIRETKYQKQKAIWDRKWELYKETGTW